MIRVKLDYNLNRLAPIELQSYPTSRWAIVNIFNIYIKFVLRLFNFLIYITLEPNLNLT